MGPTRLMWWWPTRACARTSRPASSCPPARSTSPGSPSTTRTARWSSEAGRTTGSTWVDFLRSNLILIPPPIQLDFQLASESGDMSTYVQNGEWDLKGHHHHHQHFTITNFQRRIKEIELIYQFCNISQLWRVEQVFPIPINIRFERLPCHVTLVSIIRILIESAVFALQCCT